MNKTEIFEKLSKLNLDKEKYIIISGASLVVQGIIEQTNDIDITTSTEYYNSINWQETIGAFGVAVKRLGVFDISYNLFNPNAKVVKINGYNFLNIEDILIIKKMLNREKDKKIIEKLEKIINNTDIN